MAIKKVSGRPASDHLVTTKTGEEDRPKIIDMNEAVEHTKRTLCSKVWVPLRFDDFKEPNDQGFTGLLILGAKGPGTKKTAFDLVLKLVGEPTQ